MKDTFQGNPSRFKLNSHKVTVPATFPILLVLLILGIFCFAYAKNQVHQQVSSCSNFAEEPFKSFQTLIFAPAFSFHASLALLTQSRSRGLQEPCRRLSLQYAWPYLRDDSSSIRFPERKWCIHQFLLLQSCLLFMIFLEQLSCSFLKCY